MTINKNVVSQAVRDLRHTYEESQQASHTELKQPSEQLRDMKPFGRRGERNSGNSWSSRLRRGEQTLLRSSARPWPIELNMKAERIPRTIEENIYADLLFLMMRNRQHSPKVADRFQETSELLVEAYDVLRRRFYAGARLDEIDAEDFEILDGDVAALKRKAAEKDSK